MNRSVEKFLKIIVPITTPNGGKRGEVTKFKLGGMVRDENGVSGDSPGTCLSVLRR